MARSRQGLQELKKICGQSFRQPGGSLRGQAHGRRHQATLKNCNTANS